VRTQSDKLEQLRRNVIELYVSDIPRASDNPGNRSELHDMAAQLGVTESRYDIGGRVRDLPKDESNPYFTFDPNQCIVCSRCVRACDEIQGTLALTIENRGFDSKVAA